MVELANMYEDIVRSDLPCEYKSSILNAYTVTSEILKNNAGYNSDIIEMCMENLSAISKALSCNTKLLSIMSKNDKQTDDKSKYEHECKLIDVMHDFIKSRRELTERLDITKNLLNEANRKAFDDELRYVVKNRKRI